MRRVFRNILVIVVVVGMSMLLVNNVFAGGPPGNPGGGDPPCWPAPCVPIDGGISLLLAAGLAYGGKKAYASFKGKE